MLSNPKIPTRYLIELKKGSQTSGRREVHVPVVEFSKHSRQTNIQIQAVRLDPVSSRTGMKTRKAQEGGEGTPWNHQSDSQTVRQSVSQPPLTGSNGGLMTTRKSLQVHAKFFTLRETGAACKQQCTILL